MLGRLAFLLVVLVLCAGPWPAAAQGDRRVALLVGNSAYKVGALTWPHRDVATMRAALLKIGFADRDVVVVPDADQRALKRALQDFGQRARGADVALLYYSGHAAQALERNWMIPIGADIRSEADYDLEAVSVQAALEQARRSRPRVAIVVLDACRDNPAAVTKSGTKGLGREESAERTLIAYATGYNQTTPDNGLYAQVLAAEIQKPGLEVLDVFRNTAAEVRKRSQGRQVPRVGEVTLDERVYLAGGPATATAFQAAIGNVTSPPATAPAAVPLAAPTPSSGLADGQAFRDCAECPQMVVIPAGRFLMGSPASEPERLASEGPQREVRVDRFALGKYEVTQGQWMAVMGSNPSLFKDCGDDCPVENVSWDDAQEYVRRLSQRSGQKYRLPSEAEWEYAARAGTTTTFHTGQTITSAQANFAGISTYNGSSKGEYRLRTVRVGSFAANGFGVHDMHGNVGEWVQDCYDKEAYEGKAPSDGRAYEAAGCSPRALRGGSWNFVPAGLRSANRYGRTPVDSGGDVGFRLARMLP